MRIFILLAAVLAALAGAFTPQTSAQAGRGVPGSPEFGYGARLELDGIYLDQALELAADLRFDWLVVPVRWSALQPNTPYWAKLDAVMAFAARNQMAVMISLTQPPNSVLTGSGPDPVQTAALVQDLARRYAGTLQALELFPAANVRSGWGADPNPKSYASLYNQVSAQLAAASLPVLLVGCGLQPLAAAPAAGEMDDLAFLQGVYDAGAHPAVISLLLNDVNIDPLAAPGATNRRALRHYEEVRQVMTGAGQQSSMVWITAIRAPSGTIQTAKAHSNEPQQSTWIYQAYAQMRSQLYIGVAVYQSLNPVDPPSSAHSLVTSEQYHPAAAVFRDLLSQNGESVLLPRYGRPKDEGLKKQKP
jgi:hypothetical protein